MNWHNVESALQPLSRRAKTAFAVRAARRKASDIVRLVDQYGKVVFEWWNVIDSTLHVVEAYCEAKPVSRFTLQLASEMARAVATATANVARIHGPSPHNEDAELAYAAAAFAADSAWANDDGRAVSAALRAAQLASGGDAIPPEQVLDLLALEGPFESIDATESGPLGTLWPRGEPEEVAHAWAAFQQEKPSLPKILELP